MNLAERTKHFVIGQHWCLVTMTPVNDCRHCHTLAGATAPREYLEVTAVDRESGVITLTAKERP